MDSNQLLQQLRDIKMPTPVSWWPLAPGWYVLVGVFLMLISGLLVWRFIKRKRQRYLRMALKQLQHLRKSKNKNKNKNKQVIVRKISILVRQVVVHYLDKNAAGLEGEKWLEFLNSTYGGRAFSKGAGRVLVTVPYQKTTKIDTEPLFCLIENWLKVLKRGKHV